MKEIIHFAHGNGFPSPCYKQFLQRLEKEFAVYYIDRVGHDPNYPVTENWHCLVDEVIASVEGLSTTPVHGVGHSLGGVLTLMAAIEKPELFKTVVMIDSPLLSRFKSTMVKLAKKFGFIDRVTPAGKTKGRQHHWHSREQLWSYLKTRPLFKSFRDDCLQDYIEYGFHQDEKGYSLRFNKHIEYHIFRTIPHHLPQYERQIKIPTLMIYGDKSDVVGRFDIRYMRKHYHIHCLRMHGGHMLPMEHPEWLADMITSVLSNNNELLSNNI